MYEERFYRYDIPQKLHQLEVAVGETDLFILSAHLLQKSAVQEKVCLLRNEILGYVKKFPEFKTSLSPVSKMFPLPAIAEKMIDAASYAGVGPMATVAGAIAEFLGECFSKEESSLLIENGGDIFIHADFSVTIGLYAGEENPINHLRIVCPKKKHSFGVCSSSAKLGHSLSLGNADLVTVLSRDVACCDGLATRLANMVKSRKDIYSTIEYAKTFHELFGILVVCDEEVGIWGEIELRET